MAAMTTDMDGIPDEVRSVVAQFDSTLGDIEEHLKPIFADGLSSVVEQLDPIERANLQLAMAYAINSLFFMYLRTQGIETHDHPVKDGLERVKKYMSKIKAAQYNAEKQRLRLDKEAARRFVLHSLPADAIVGGKVRESVGNEDDAIENEDSVMQDITEDVVQKESQHKPDKLRAKKQAREEENEPPKKKKHKKRHAPLDGRMPDQR